ncbi:MASE1 domain-containing protein [Nocardia sp. NPDC052566]|uniref:MASE1 domain-containing protein n=1 Tax=Nocardia sp. NPDC052566 TaxID=3364330 RepID=UPI0037C7BB5D
MSVRGVVPALWIVAVAAAYFGAAQIGLRLALVGGQVTPLWPPTGISLACLLLLGLRIWPGIALGALLTNLALGPSVPAVLLIAVGNTAAPVCAYLLLRQTGFRERFDRFRDGLALVFLGALAGMLISATIGSAVLAFVAGRGFWTTWWVWWAGDAMGVLIFAPLLLVARTARMPKEISLFRAAEAVALVVGTFLAVALPAFGRQQLDFVVFPFLIWAGVRFQLAGALPCALIASLVTTFAVSRNLPAFDGLGLTAKMIHLQMFNATVTLTALLHATVIAQRDHARQAVDAACAELARGLVVLSGHRPLGEGVAEVVNRVLSTRIQSGERPG